MDFRGVARSVALATYLNTRESREKTARDKPVESPPKHHRIVGSVQASATKSAQSHGFPSDSIAAQTLQAFHASR